MVAFASTAYHGAHMFGALGGLSEGMADKVASRLLSLDLVTARQHGLSSCVLNLSVRRNSRSGCSGCSGGDGSVHMLAAVSQQSL